MTGRRTATLRLAWRLARGARGRSALIALLVAIPVLAGTFAAVTIRTAHLSPAEAAARQLGRADAIAVVTGKPLTGDVAVGRSTNGETISNIPYTGDGRTPTGTTWADALPAGSRVTPDAWVRAVRVAAGVRAAEVQGIVLDLSDPMTDGIYRVRSGQVPTTSGQAAVTTALAKQMHVSVGATIDLADHPTRVTAVVENPNDLGERSVVASAATFGGLNAPARGTWWGNVDYWLVDTPGAAPDLHDRLLHDGVVYETRDQWEHPGPGLTSSSQIDGQVLIVLGTVAGFGLLEVLLLAGAAFAVGTRRQTRELGLLAATGGDDTDIRRTVLIQGALLGIGGAVVGVAGGVLAVVLLRGVLEQVANKRFGGLDVAAADLVAVVVLGVVAGLLAAIVPARAAAARPVLSMLRDRYDADERPTSIPRWAVLAIVGGAALTVVAAFRWHADAGSLRSTFVSTGSFSAVMHGLATMLRENQWPAALWLGAAAMLAGLVRACPAIVARLASLSRPLPLTARLALRDAGRHRHRTAPAVAAVMTVVAGAVLVLFVASSSDLRDKHEFSPAIPIGVIDVQNAHSDGMNEAALAAAAARTATLVGGGSHVVISQASRPRGGTLVVQNPGCTHPATDDLAVCSFHQVGVATATTIDLIAGRTVPAAHRALATGGAVLLDPNLADGRTVVISTTGPARHRTSLPAVVVPGLPSYGAVPQVYVSAATATAQGWHIRGDIALVAPTRTPSTEVMARAQSALGSNITVTLQSGYHSRYSAVLLAMLGAAAIATLAGTSIAVALAMAESRADMATMAAVGASPSRRRVHAMSQAATVAGLGTGLGMGLGVLVALATLGGSDVFPTSAPYRWLVAVLVVAPALAIAVAGAFTRSRVTLTRRIA